MNGAAPFAAPYQIQIQIQTTLCSSKHLSDFRLVQVERGARLVTQVWERSRVWRCESVEMGPRSSTPECGSMRCVREEQRERPDMSVSQLCVQCHGCEKVKKRWLNCLGKHIIG